MRYSTPQEFYDRWYGKSVDVDNYPPRQPDQCWDLKAKFVLDEGLKVNTYCNLTGYAGDLYKLRYEKGYDQYFEFYYPSHAKRGDWIYWNQHVAMVWDVDLKNDKVLCLGQNQSGHPYVDLKWYKLSTALGCMRYKKWMEPMNGWKKEGKHWCYYIDGKKVTGIQTLKWSGGNDKFVFSDQGVMLTGWQKVAGKWYYLASSGAAVKGIQTLTWNGKEDVYYFDPETCVMQTGEITMELLFNGSGALIGGKKV